MPAKKAKLLRNISEQQLCHHPFYFDVSMSDYNIFEKLNKNMK